MATVATSVNTENKAAASRFIWDCLTQTKFDRS